jgi:hypothetical protein
VDLVRLCVDAEDLSLASQLIHGAEAFTTRHRLSVASARATLQEGLGALDEAAGLYDEAAHDWATFGHVVEAGRASLGAGRCLTHSRPEESVARLLHARSIFEDLGASVLVAETDASLAETAGSAD